DVIDVKLEELNDRFKIPISINQIQEIPGVKNVSLGTGEVEQSIMPDIQLPKGMPNISPEMIQARIRETMSDPKKLIMAWKRMPMTTGMFLNAPLSIKKQIANMFDDKLLEEVPETIKQEIVKIKKGEVEEEEELEPSISISCEEGGKQLPLIIQKISENGLKIKSVNMHEPTLEDVFLHYVGTTIRDETSNHTKDVKKMIQMRQLRK
ncbi:MAG: DUF4162 domain-containing protein, partial [Candidatus Hodarchaeota archaeon]